ncbi:MAG TPA: hypothetical protein VGF94_01660, partial [Kofleriaceae bacterium]
MKVLIGIALVVAHAIAFVAVAAHSHGTELVVELRAPRSIDGRASDPRAVVATTGEGLAHRTWTTMYRGGFARAVGASALVGPQQDPAAPPCGGRLVVGQALLDELSHAVAGTIDAQLRGQSAFPIGAYQRLDGFTLHWARDDLRALVGDAGAPHGYVRANAVAVFERARVTLAVALVPERAGAELHFRVGAHADVQFDNRAEQWLADKLGADKLASRLARLELDDALVTTFALPPPFDLGDGQTLAFVTCDAPIEIVDGAYGILPFAVSLGRVAGAPEILPPRFTPALAQPPAAGTRLALDLDLNALDAMLYELWRTGWLDRRLAEAGLDRAFNADSTVTDFLSVRISAPTLALAPVVTPAGGNLRLAADARIAIIDEGQRTIGRVYGALDLAIPGGIDLGALELSCEKTAATLVPCYGDLVAALRDRGADFHGALTTQFTRLVETIFTDRQIGGLPADLT